jgi:alpha-ketoglutaric semialdehyde dehydrogenase
VWNLPLDNKHTSIISKDDPQMTTQQVLVGGEWRDSVGSDTFQAVNPTTKEALPEQWPLSPWSEIDQAIESAKAAFCEVRGWPGEKFAAFLEAYATEIEARADALVEAAHAETALPVSPRLKDGELPRTTNQLRQAATAARAGSWRTATIDSAANIRAMYGAIGPVVVFGPNNFPFAFNGISGGDFAAAVAAGNPVIAKGHSSHPRTTRVLAEAAHAAAQSTGMPAGFVQLIYRTSHADGCKLVSDHRIGACGYTGARRTGLILKEAADKAGTPIYLELSSVNPVFVLPGALAERADAIVDEYVGSCLMGTGQFCTSPGLVVVEDSAAGQQLIAAVAEKFSAAAVGTLLGEGVQKSFIAGINTLCESGAELVTGGQADGGNGFSCGNTLLKTTGQQFLADPDVMQTEAFGNGGMVVVASDMDQMVAIADHLEGNLTGCIYSHTGGNDDAAYDRIAVALRQRVGRLLNDKMPTGVAVSPAMNHGGPYPATGHPTFTAVGIPGSLVRFSMLQCYDNVRPHRLPPELQDENSNPDMWRLIDGTWTTGNVG